MENYTFNSAEDNVDAEVGYYCHFVSGDEDAFRPHYHDYYEIFITVSGIVTHWINGIESKLPEGSLVFIRPHDVHGYLYNTPQSTKTSYINFAFSTETAKQLFTYIADSFPCEALLSSSAAPYVILSEIEKKRLIRRISELNTVNINDKNAMRLQAKVLLADIFAHFSEHVDPAVPDSMPLWLSHLMRNMEHYENFSAGLERMLDISGKSREHLSRCMKKYLNTTPSDYINSLKVNYASNLLINTDSSITDICYKSGFSSLSYFYRIFNNTYGVSPKKYRQNYRKL